MKYAIEFQFEKLEDGSLDVIQPGHLIGDKWWIDDAFEFDIEYWEWFTDEGNTPELKGLNPGVYHVFAYGDVIEEWDRYPEFDKNFDGLTCEPEYTKITELK